MILGYRPRKNTVVDSRKYFKDELVYDVTYSIDANGLRIAPPVTPGSGERCILFFGGSFTFGEGVEDDTTTAYQVGQRLEGRYRIFNFGFHGYGPHQMLSALESGLAKSISSCNARYVIYLVLVEHVQRPAGLALWDLEGPRYLLAANGVERDGSLFENSGLPLPVIRFLKKWHLFRTIITRLYGNVDYDLKLDADPAVMLCKYEDTITDPERYVRRLFEFVGGAFSSSYVAKVSSASINKCKPPALDPEIAKLCGDLLERIDASYQRQLRNEPSQTAPAEKV
jgi:hypothetical protein